MLLLGFSFGHHFYFIYFFCWTGALDSRLPFGAFLPYILDASAYVVPLLHLVTHFVFPHLLSRLVPAYTILVYDPLTTFYMTIASHDSRPTLLYMCIAPHLS